MNKSKKTGTISMALELEDGYIVDSKTSDLLSAPAALILNALKHLANVNDEMLLISPSIIEPISKMKVQNLGNHNPRIHVAEILIALAVSARTNPLAELAMKNLHKLAQCQASVFKKLKIDFTSEPIAHAKKLYVKYEK